MFVSLKIADHVVWCCAVRNGHALGSNPCRSSAAGQCLLYTAEYQTTAERDLDMCETNGSLAWMCGLLGSHFVMECSVGFSVHFVWLIPSLLIQPECPKSVYSKFHPIQKIYPSPYRWYSLLMLLTRAERGEDLVWQSRAGFQWGRLGGRSGHLYWGWAGEEGWWKRHCLLCHLLEKKRYTVFIPVACIESNRIEWEMFTVCLCLYIWD